MEFNPKVSIIIPVYNGSNYLQEAIDSALAQSYKNIEIIVVNDGSNDCSKTEKIATSYSDKIKYFYKENGGVASALNMGIGNMTGNYFSWLSHDDIYFPDKIEKQVRYLEGKENKEIITYCDSELIDKDSKTIRISRIDQEYLKNLRLTVLSSSIGGCSYLIPRVCFEKVGFFNEKLKTTQDNEMWLRIAMAGFAFQYLPEILVKYRSHPNQGSKIWKNYHEKEREEYYLWAIHYIGDEIHTIYHDLCVLLMMQKCFKAHKELLKLKYPDITLLKYCMMTTITAIRTGTILIQKTIEKWL